MHRPNAEFMEAWMLVVIGLSHTNQGKLQPTIYQHEVWNPGALEPELYYYIVPGGMNVVFKDEAGNEVSR